MNKLQEAAAKVEEEYVRGGGVSRVTMERLFAALFEPETDIKPIGYVEFDDLAGYRLSRQGRGLTVYKEQTEDIDIPVYLTVPDDENEPYLVEHAEDMRTCTVRQSGVDYQYHLHSVGSYNKP